MPNTETATQIVTYLPRPFPLRCCSFQPTTKISKSAKFPENTETLLLPLWTEWSHEKRKVYGLSSNRINFFPQILCTEELVYLCTGVFWVIRLCENFYAIQGRKCTSTELQRNWTLIFLREMVRSSSFFFSHQNPQSKRGYREVTLHGIYIRIDWAENGEETDQRQREEQQRSLNFGATAMSSWRSETKPSICCCCCSSLLHQDWPNRYQQHPSSKNCCCAIESSSRTTPPRSLSQAPPGSTRPASTPIWAGVASTHYYYYSASTPKKQNQSVNWNTAERTRKRAKNKLKQTIFLRTEALEEDGGETGAGDGVSLTGEVEVCLLICSVPTPLPEIEHSCGLFPDAEKKHKPHIISYVSLISFNSSTSNL